MSSSEDVESWVNMKQEKVQIMQEELPVTEDLTMKQASGKKVVVYLKVPLRNGL